MEELKSLEQRILDHENKGQLHLAAAMKLKGTIKNIQEFAIKQAPLIREILDGNLYVDDHRWESIKVIKSINK